MLGPQIQYPINCNSVVTATIHRKAKKNPNCFCLNDNNISSLLFKKSANFLTDSMSSRSHKKRTASVACLLWQYGLWSFQTGGTKLERFLRKNQRIQRKLLNFEFWINGELS